MCRARTYPRWTPSGLIMMYVRSVSKRPAKTWSPPRAEALAATAPRASAATPCARGLRAAVARADFAAGATRAAARTPERRSTEARAGAATRAAEAEMAKDMVVWGVRENARVGVCRAEAAGVRIERHRAVTWTPGPARRSSASDSLLIPLAPRALVRCSPSRAASPCPRSPPPSAPASRLPAPSAAASHAHGAATRRRPARRRLPPARRSSRCAA